MRSLTKKTSLLLLILFCLSLPFNLILAGPGTKVLVRDVAPPGHKANATFKIDGVEQASKEVAKDSDFKIDIEPKAGYWISSVYADGQKQIVDESNREKFSATFRSSKDEIPIMYTVSKYVTFKVEGHTAEHIKKIAINELGQQVEREIFKTPLNPFSNVIVYLETKPYFGISSLKINGKDTVPTFRDKYAAFLPKDQDYTFSVVTRPLSYYRFNNFSKEGDLYLMGKENKVDPALYSQIQFFTGFQADFKIEPKPNYYISKVTVDNVDEDISQVERGKAYDFSIVSKNKDYNINVEFALQEYKTSFQTASTGVKYTVNNQEQKSIMTKYGEAQEVVIKADPNYYLKEVKIANKAIDFTEGKFNEYSFNLAKVEQDQTVDLVFAETKVKNIPIDLLSNEYFEIKLNDHPLYQDQDEIVLDPDTKIASFTAKSPAFSHIRLNPNDPMSTDLIDTVVKEMYKNQSITIDNIYVYTGKDKNQGAKALTGLGLKISYDDDKARIKIKPKEKKKVYTGDVELNIEVKDHDPTAGLESVKYEIFNYDDNTKALESEYLYNAANTRAGIYTGETYPLTISAAKYKNNHLRLEVTAEDKAGNISKAKKEFIIITAEPRILLSYDNNKAVKGKVFDQARTLSLSFVESDYTFNEALARKAIKITGPDQKKIELPMPFKVSQDQQGQDVRTYTIPLSKVGDYKLAINYTNSTGKKGQVAVAKDTVAPYDFSIQKPASESKVAVTGEATYLGYSLILFALAIILVLKKRAKA